MNYRDLIGKEVKYTWYAKQPPSLKLFTVGKYYRVEDVVKFTDASKEEDSFLIKKCDSGITDCKTMIRCFDCSEAFREIRNEKIDNILI